MYSLRKDTIAALATPPGEGAIAIVRISGLEAFSIAQKVFSGPVLSYKTHTAHYGNIIDEERNIIDSILLIVFRAPKSYTGEDSVELYCHGGALLSRLVLEQVIRAGARIAQPGEFSLRAFLNGKVDLSQAEAVQELIAAKNSLALSSAQKHLEGELSQRIRSFQKTLTEIAATLEASVDFPEEDLEVTSKETLSSHLQSLIKQMKALSSSFYEGKKISEGLSLCILGAPNVGKSSLMNALCGKERAIVTSIPGTTRDLLEEPLLLGSLHYRLIDTAGIRKTDEPIELEGIRRAKKAFEEADLVLLVLDASRPLEPEDFDLLQVVSSHRTIVVWNKIDLAQPKETLSLPWSVSLSAKKGQGIDTLKTTIEQLSFGEKGPPSKEEIFLTQLRHKEALDRAIPFCEKALQGVQENGFPELISSDIRSTLHELSSIIGTQITEDILSEIFSKFCLGK